MLISNLRKLIRTVIISTGNKVSTQILTFIASVYRKMYDRPNEVSIQTRVVCCVAFYILKHTLLRRNYI